jgi:sec-independent protein translocase protein TatB
MAGAYNQAVFNIGPEKIGFILIIALIVLGPEQLPDAARKIGDAIRQLQRMSTGVDAEIRSALNAVIDAEPPTDNPSREPPTTDHATAENHPNH